MSDRNEPRAEYDSPWKDIIGKYFPEFLEFFFPAAHGQIDWSKKYEFQETELQSRLKIRVNLIASLNSCACCDYTIGISQLPRSIINLCWRLDNARSR
ncbi:MAG: hypothetical protein AB4352_05135 [Hormoscilla sp.]